MLHFYIGEESLPKDAKFVYNPDKFSIILDLTKDEYTQNVIEVVEHATVHDRNHFTDQFGVTISSTDMSTSSRILILAHQTDWIVNASELGYTAVQFLLYNESESHLYFRSKEYLPVIERYPVCINSVVCNSRREYFDIESRLE